MSNGQHRQSGETAESPDGQTTADTRRKARLYYLGSGSIAVPALAALAACAGFELVGVGTQPDRPQGRNRRPTPTPVGAWCAEHSIAVDKPGNVNDPGFLQRLAALRLDLIVVFSFGQILSKALLSVPRSDCVNVHASLLPRYRGASPVSAVILAGDCHTGISYMRMVRKLDAGAVYEQVSVALSDRDTTPELEARLADLAATTVCDTLSRILDGRLTAREQDHSEATYAGKLQKADGWIDWQEDAARIDRQVRAYHPWPGARALVDTPRGVRHVTLTDVAVVPRQREDAVPGTVTTASKHDLVIACGRDSLQVRRLIPEGSREMTGPEYLRGTPLQEGSILRHETANCQS